MPFDSSAKMIIGFGQSKVVDADSLCMIEERSDIERQVPEEPSKFVVPSTSTWEKKLATKVLEVESSFERSKLEAVPTFAKALLVTSNEGPSWFWTTMEEESSMIKIPPEIKTPLSLDTRLKVEVLNSMSEFREFNGLDVEKEDESATIEVPTTFMSQKKASKMNS